MARKILLADDSVTAQNMGRKILADAGYEVITVNNGSAALKKISEHKPDLIVLDVYMPGYSGLEVCQRLKEVGETARIPILLTVGKLEPFKTDEAKRVRADGFIVKPFEASELLSALSKLEDKIVPRAESKPGRFARATAAIEEGRDRTVAADEDNGWKSRIAFPSKKKKTAPEADADDPAIYNPVNKDLRTVVDHHPVEPPKEEPQQERVDLGALAPEGLPKDVTPEEIAALAAAAAQMQGKILESKAAEEREAPAEVKAENPQALAQPEPVADSPSITATFAEQAAQEKVEIASSASEVPGIASEVSAPPQQETPVHAVTEEPVTMAAAAGAHSGGSVSRWTAVAVALAPEESGISLEQEMQRAYVEFAATQTERSSAASAVTVAEPVAEIAATPVNESTVVEPTTVAEPATESSGAVTPAPTDAISASVKELESASVQSENAAAPVGNFLADAAEPPLAAVQEPASVSESTRQEAPVTEEPAKPEEPVATAEPEASQIPAPELQAENQEPVAATPESAVSEISADPGSGSQIPSEATSAVSSEPSATSDGDSEKKEPDFSVTTAAAWASWRRIRESGDAHPAEPSQNDKAAEEAAMAVAAGAEKSPEEVVDAESDPAIASIVDSVLADLRPKIVEEISRKLGKKK